MRSICAVLLSLGMVLLVHCQDAPSTGHSCTTSNECLRSQTCRNGVCTESRPPQEGSSESSTDAQAPDRQGTTEVSTPDTTDNESTSTSPENPDETPPSTGFCYVECCDGTVHPTQIPSAQCSEVNLSLFQPCGGIQSATALRFKEHLIWSSGSCTDSCKVECCDGSRFSFALSANECNDPGRFQKVCESHFDLLRISHVDATTNDTMVLWDRDRKTACVGACKLTCCDGTPHELRESQENCTAQTIETLAKQYCPSGQALRLRYNGTEIWKRSDTQSCPGECQIQCCPETRITLALPPSHCDEKNQLLLEKCTDIGETAQSIRFNGQVLWESNATCLSSCQVQCCDGSVSTLSLPKEQCSENSQEVIKKCGSTSNTYKISLNGKAIWENTGACLQCHVRCCPGYPGGGSTKETAANCTLSQQQSKCQSNRVASIYFHNTPVHFATCPNLCYVSCCPGYGVGRMISTSISSCTPTIQKALCTEGQIASTTFGTQVTPSATACPARGTCHIRCCFPGISFDRTVYKPECYPSTLPGACDNNYTIKQLSFQGVSQWGPANCPTGECVIRCCKSGTNPISKKGVPADRCNLTEQKGACEGKGGIRTIRFNGRLTFEKTNDPNCK